MSHKCRRFVDKVAVLTSATKGITFATAQRLAEEGARVFVSSRKADQVSAAVEELRQKGYEAAGRVCHVGKEEDIKALFEEVERMFGGIDILIASTGVSTRFGSTLGTTSEEYDKMFEINTKAVFRLIQEAVPYFRKRGGGSIVLNGTNGHFNQGMIGKDYNPATVGVYCASKLASIGLMRALVNELCADHIRINCVASGPIVTDFTLGLQERRRKNGYHQANIDGVVPMGRLGNPGEVAACMAFLASDDASYVTGETIVAAGGLSNRL